MQSANQRLSRLISGHLVTLSTETEDLSDLQNPLGELSPTEELLILKVSTTVQSSISLVRLRGSLRASLFDADGSVRIADFSSWHSKLRLLVESLTNEPAISKLDEFAILQKYLYCTSPNEPTPLPPSIPYLAKVMRFADIYYNEILFLLASPPPSRLKPVSSYSHSVFADDKDGGKRRKMSSVPEKFASALYIELTSHDDLDYLVDEQTSF